MATCGEITIVGEDESELTVEKSIRSDEPEQITVEYTVENVPTSGYGEENLTTIHIDLNGEEVERVQVGSLEPEETYEDEYTIDGVGEGQHEVCVRAE